MVKAVVGEETQLNSAENRLLQSGIPAEVGLVIGKLNSDLDRGFLFDLIPTPPNDAGEPACSISGSGRDEKKKSSKGKSQSETSLLLIDRDWVAEHARQVSKMLLGGMNVVGIYVWAMESSFKASSTILWQTVKGVAEAAPFYQSGLDERLLIHISYSPRRWTCRNCILGLSMTSNSLRPCDFKMGKLLAALQTFRCRYNFEIRFPIFLEDASSNTLRDILRDVISCHAKELKAARAIVDGNMVFSDQQNTLDRVHEVELLLPFMKDGLPEACSMKEVIGLVNFAGAIYSSAYLCPKESIAQAISDIKGDIITSLRSRLDIICDVSEGDMESNVEVSDDESNKISIEKPAKLILHDLRKRCTIPFPKRVLVPWLADVFICDYLQPSETIEDVKDHCKEMLSMNVPTDTSAILEVETEATTLGVKSFWDAFCGKSASESDRVARKKENSTREIGKKAEHSSFSFLIAIAILLLAVVIGLGIIALGF